MRDAKTYAFYLPKDLGERLQSEAANERRSASSYLALLLERAFSSAPCPTCDGPTFEKDGIRYCDRCNMVVAVV